MTLVSATATTATSLSGSTHSADTKSTTTSQPHHHPQEEAEEYDAILKDVSDIDYHNVIRHYDYSGNHSVSSQQSTVSGESTTAHSKSQSSRTQESSHYTHRISRASAAPSYYSIGRDFYDDCYSEDDSEDSIDDRLDFNSKRVRVLARKQELQTLHDVYGHVQRKGMPSNKKRDMKQETSVAMIQGLSGTGKSTLVQKFVADLEKQSKVKGGPKRPLFLSGKYDELSGTDPFSAIVEAFSGLAADLLKEESGPELERIHKAIQESLGGSDLSALTSIIPELEHVIQGRDTSSRSLYSRLSSSSAAQRQQQQQQHQQQETGATATRENAWNRLRFLFQAFSNAISTEERPVIMFLDDMQWCDPASLDLIQALLTDKELRYFMFLGAYRSDEVNDANDHPLKQALANIQAAQPIQTVQLDNLSQEGIEGFLSDVLKYSEEEMTEEMKGLAAIIHSKTKGNLFFAMQVLEELHRKGVLQFSRLTFQWEWHGDAKLLDELLVDDIVTAMTMKIKSSSPMVQQALVTAAYTRSNVDCHTLHTLISMDMTEGNSISLEDVIKALDKAVIEGLLSNNMGSTNYSFSHDRIQQAAYSIIPEGEPRNEFRSIMGNKLYRLGHDEERGEDWMLFAAADHLNATLQPGGTKDLMESIQLNLEVGERAASVSAHATASKFLGIAMQNLLLLQGNPWEDQYETTLRVYRLIADGELNQGRFDIGSGIAKQIMKHAKCLDDRLPTSLSWARAMGRENLHRESLRLGKATLRAIRQHPNSKVALVGNVVRDLIIVKRHFSKTSDEELVSLPIMTDKRMEMTMEFLSTTAYNSFYVGKMVQYLAIVLKMLRITFKYGLCGQGGVAFTGYSLFSNNINDMTNAYRFFHVARAVLEKTKAKHLEGLQLFVFAHWVGSWKDPDTEILEIYDQATKSAMESGDFENGMLSSTAGIHHAFVNSHHLEELDLKYTNLMEQLDTYKVDSVKCMTEEQWLVIQYLRGTAVLPELDYDELNKFGPNPEAEGDDDQYRLLYGYMGRLQLGFYFGNYEFTMTMLERLEAIPDFDKAHSTNSLRLYFASLILCHYARITGKKSYLRRATKYWQHLRNLCKIKGLQSWHRTLLLEAHIKAAGGGKNSNSSMRAQASYDHAIAAAVKNGHYQDAGLAAQLAGENFMRMNDESLHSKVLLQARDQLIRTYCAKARDHYMKWGATALIKHLETIHEKYFDSFLVRGKENGDGDKSSKGETGSAAFTFNSLQMGSEDSFRDLPMVFSARPLTKDDISIISDQSAWRNAKQYLNPHTDTGDFPAMSEELINSYPDL